MTATYTLTGQVANLVGDFDLSRAALRDMQGYVEGSEEFINDPSTNQQRYGRRPLTFAANGSWSVANLLATGPTTTAAYRVVIFYNDGSPNAQTRQVTSNWFELTSSQQFGSVVSVALTAVSTAVLDSVYDARADAQAAQAAAEAARDATVSISGISTSDGVVEALVKNTAGAGPLTSAALLATFARLNVAALEATPVYVYGDSYGQGAQGDDEVSRPAGRLQRRLQTQAPVINAVSGTRMDEVTAKVASTWTPNTRGMVLLADGLINDVKQNADDAGATTAREAFRATLARLTSVAVLPPTASTFVFGPNWSSGTSSTAGAYFDFSFDGDTAHLLLNMVSTTGGVLEVRNAADATVASVSTGGFKRTIEGALEVSGLGAGTHPLRAVLASGTVTITGLAVPSATPPLIVWDKPGRYSSNNAEATRLALYQSTCAAILDATFPTVLQVDVGDAGWDYATMISADQTHRNQLGNKYATDKIEAALRTRLTTGYVQGLNAVTLTTAAAPYIAPTTAYAKTGATTPAAPGSFVATAGQQVSFTWTKPTDGGATLTGYIIERSPAGAGTWTTLATITDPNTTSLNVTSGLTATTSYDFRIKATNAIGTGTASATSTATAGTAPTTYSADTFTRADSTSLGSTETGSFAWSAVGGSAGISTNRLAFTAVTNAAQGATVIMDDAQTNGTFSIRLMTVGIASGLFFASSADTFSAYVLWRSSNSVLTLSKRTSAGAYSALATFTYTQQSSDLLTVVKNAGAMTVKVNGITLAPATGSTTDASPLTGTRSGAWTQGLGIFDDYSHTSSVAA